MTQIDFNKITLTPATLKDYPVIQNMARFYVYDMTEYMGFEQDWEIAEDGLYECFDLKKYWEDITAHPFLIHYQNEIAGFAIIDKKGSDTEVDYNMAQFFILRKFKSKGFGRAVAEQCFNQFIGTWEVMVMPENTGAYQFWKKVIKNYTNEEFTEYTKQVKVLKDSLKNIFRFKSRYKTS